MATYQYRCHEHALVETTRPIGTTPEHLGCPTCGGPACRGYSAPRLSLADRRAVALLDRTERTRETPAVVRSLPGQASARPQVRASPAQRRQPRPFARHRRLPTSLTSPRRNPARVALPTRLQQALHATEVHRAQPLAPRHSTQRDGSNRHPPSGCIRLLPRAGVHDPRGRAGRGPAVRRRRHPELLLDGLHPHRDLQPRRAPVRERPDPHRPRHGRAPSELVTRGAAAARRRGSDQRGRRHALQLESSCAFSTPSNSPM